MEKTGEVRTGVTPCDICGRPAVSVDGMAARCFIHMSSTKSAQKTILPDRVIHFKSFTEPLEEEIV